MDKNVHAGHRSRLLEQAVQQELEAFYPHQVLELLLFYAIPRQDTSAIAHRLLDRFGTVQAVLEAPSEELVRVQGVGSRAAGWLKCVEALTRTYGALRQSDRPRVGTIMDAVQFCVAREESIQPPSVMQLNLTPTGRVQSFSRVANSEAWAEPRCLRASMREMLSLHSKRVIVAVYPGRGDLAIDPYHTDAAQAYNSVLNAMGITLMDVLILFEGKVTSLRRRHAMDAVEDPLVTQRLAEEYLSGADQ